MRSASSWFGKRRLLDARSSIAAADPAPRPVAVQGPG
jgi:hypothetical protein